MKNWAIYFLVVLVAVLLVFVLFQYYSATVNEGAGAKETKLQEVQVYFANKVTNPEMLDCSLVFPVRRVISLETNIYESTIEQLLTGPSEAEKQQGYETLIPVAAKVNFVSFDNGVVTADFDKNLDYAVGGSCWVSAIRSQIEKTLSQWATVKKVIISINGESEMILQP